MATHNITRAAVTTIGGVNYPAYHTTTRGIGNYGLPSGFPIFHSLGTPAVADADGIATAQAVASATTLTLNGAAVSSGVATLTPARNVTILSAGNDSGITFTVTGTDAYGETLVETITGANAGTANGKKAFLTVVSVASSAAAAGNVSVGFGDVLGLPYRIDNKNQAQVMFDGAADAATIVVAATATATATTGDTRGTIDIAGTLNGSKSLHVMLWGVDASSQAGAFGVTQYGG